MVWLRLLVWLCFSVLAVSADAFDECGELQNAYGPFDYRSASAQVKNTVEGTHFLPYTERLQKGHTGSVGAEIDYTLRAFPNHPRALMAMMKLGIKEKTEMPYGASWSVSCYFDRAVRFAPDDPAVHTIYGIYFVKKGDRQAARHELEMAEAAIRGMGGDANLSYNLGLTYFDLNDYDKALEQAKAAYALGFPLPGLRDKLKRANKWVD